MLDQIKNKQIFSQKNIEYGLKSFFSREYFHSALVQWMIIGALLLNVTNWGLIAYFIRPVDFPIILHYNVYFGVDVIGAWWQVYFLPIIGLVILLINSIVGYLFYAQKERIVAHLLMLASFIAQIGIMVALACILMINY